MTILRKGGRHAREQRFQLLVELVMGLITLLAFVPILVMLVTSFKTNVEIYHDFFALPKRPHLENYGDAFRLLFRNMLNTIGVVGLAVVLTLVLAAVSGFVFARLDFPGKRLLYLLLLALMMIPGNLYFAPNYVLIQKYGLFNTWWALIFPWISGGQILGIVLCRNSIEQLPADLFEAARLEGCGELGELLYIAVPLAKPILSTVAVMQMVGYYNDFIWPMMVIESNTRQVITVAVRVFTNAQGTVNIGSMFAGYVIATLPILVLFLFTSRLYMEGMTAGAVKG
ncbi:carbohydrate ABC transporter permease [Lachnoclostridium sp. Marseille-P6806]|uniref:carbohydrate ABC transporter permease n=1 Tax=Lachnoclostridium sp. Marseille-P6806 TaxID=2364793 RepID=UPI0013EEF78A|nr:carbohydrate ABC transporter permease [Lachnoclostridium sp. Marseille-P6806]